MPSSRAIYFLFFYLFLKIASLEEQLSHDLLDLFWQSFHRMKAYWVQMIYLDLFFRYLKGR